MSTELKQLYSLPILVVPDDPVIRRTVPTRRIGQMLVLGTGGTTDPVLLDETATRIWNGLNHWTTPAELTNQVHASFPTTDADIISEAVAMTLERLSGAGLLERE